MWCMVKSRRVHLGYWLAFACHNLAIRPVRHLTICHVLGAFVKNNLRLDFVIGCQTEMCLEPELFDIEFFKNIKILFSTDKKKMRFYMPGQPDQQMVPLKVRRDEEEAGGSKRPERQQPAQARSTPDSEWKGRVEQMLLDLGQNAIAQRELMETQSQFLARSMHALERLADYMEEYLTSQCRASSASMPTPSRQVPALPLIDVPPAARPEHRSHPTGKRTRSPSFKPRRS